MADGDIVHDKLSLPYQKVYKMLCEGKADPEECAWMVELAMRKDIQKKGAAPIVLAKRMGEILKEAMENFNKNGSRNWGAVSDQLKHLARQTSCPHDIKELILRASKVILHDFRYGRRTDTDALAEVTVVQYIRELYRSNFKERIPLTREHYAGIDTATLMIRVKALDPELSPVFDKWGKQANADPYHNVAKLKRPPRRKLEELDLDDNLL
ncbi:hypothetical protein [Laspinema olomoucense]|uniref:DUF4145 domain-containing protein n=1 Tax=Laspinema olomoucense D3b TaxID=2953688 RepID=A0ABT2N8P8_9CYAN|nr:hypothetical protein [Laspinema sp. D3b]MCT7979061.1 hypothetical protein [Laspinema sp. D3b]